MDNKEISGVELTFGPDWARKSPEKWTVSERNSKQDAKPRREWQKTPGKPRDNARFGSRGRNRNNAGEFESRKESFRPAFTDKRRSPQAVVLPKITVSFIPERSGLKPLVRQFASTRRAYSLFEIAAIFLSKPKFYAAAIEATGNDGTPPLPLYQCLECKAVFANKQSAFAHGLNRHMNLFYDREEKEYEPPQGKFSCVARCTLSGELLGPPNYHEFNDKLLELHRTRFADLPIDQYRKKIVNETDPASIEQWKKNASCKTIYRTKLLDEPVTFKRSSLLERHFTENYATTLIREGHRFVIPATVSQDMDDHQIRHFIQEAREKETRFPINMASAIQKRFHRLGLHIFKTARMTFVSAVRPRPIDPAQTTDTIRHILEWIRANAGKTRPDLVAILVPGPVPESTAVTEIINSLVWLIDRGHVIEFTNGTLAVPNWASPEAKRPGLRQRLCRGESAYFRASAGKKELKKTSSSADSNPSGNDLQEAANRRPETDPKRTPIHT
ncbi:MAG: hypothetical protein Q7J98_05350 [Kiritimatiellia bacterium]|nr:hypothetical protein [Kiritimatiellia bacterium]